MNDPRTAAPIVAAAKAAYDEVPLAKIDLSKTPMQKLRRERFDKPALKELTQSVAEHGVLQPILLRRHNGANFELVAGERRYLASKAAGKDTVPAIIRDLTDLQVIEMQVIENNQREDLHKLIEAEGFEQLMKAHKFTADDIAAKIGKSRSYVYGVLKYTDLCPEARRAFYDGELDSSRALLIARIGHHDTQRKALKEITQGVDHWNRRPLSYREAAKHVHEHYMLALDKAPFDTKDAKLLPKAGSCADCPKRTGNQPELFADVKRADVCTDPKCFSDKKEAGQEKLRAAARAKGTTVISGDAAKKIKPHSYDGGDLNGYTKLDERVWQDEKKRTAAQLMGKSAPPATLLEDPHTGKFIAVVKNEDFKKALKESGVKLKYGQVETGRSNDGDKYAAQQRAMERRRRLQTEGRLRVLKAIREKVGAKLGGHELRVIAIAYFERTWHENQKRLITLWGSDKKPNQYKAASEFASLSEKDLACRLMDMALIGDAHVGNYQTPSSTDLLHQTAKHYKINAEKIKDAVFAEDKAKRAEKKRKAAAAEKKAEKPAKADAGKALPQSARPKHKATGAAKGKKK